MSLVAGIGIGIPFGGAVPAGPSSPAGVGNGVAYFKAGLGMTFNGGDIQKWDDQFGNSNNLEELTASRQPLYKASNPDFNGKPTVDFDGIAHRMETAPFTGGDISQPNTIMIAVKMNATTSNDFVFDGLTIGKRNAFYIHAGTYTQFSGSNLNQNVVDTLAHIFALQYNTTSSQGYKGGGAPMATGDIGIAVMDGLSLGSDYAEGQHGNFDVAALAIYDRLLTDAEMNAIGNEWATEYALPWVDIGSGPAVGDGLLLENGTDFLILESGDFLLLE